ncbi:heat-inducible transcription repressor HrcA, partial [bacterium]|nr:heat-inducible transcription repressor HrcA [bacterium]
MIIANSKDSSRLRPLPALNERQKLVLKGVCDAFILTGKPVGSRTISKFGMISVCPATIRNEMADLEEMGLLESPHTSAGRIPTELGYHFYVSFLLEYKRLSQIEETLLGILAKKFEEQERKQNKILKLAVRLACDMAHLPGVVLIPQKPQSIIRSVKLIRLLEDKVMVVFIEENGKISDQISDIPSDTSSEMLEALGNCLNEEICNKRIGEIDVSSLKKSHGLLIRFNKVLSSLASRLCAAIEDPDTDKVFFEGFVNFFEQAEFKDPEKMRAMMQMLDKKESLLYILAKRLEKTDDNIVMNIGSEAGLEVKDLSVVTAKYQGPSQSFGRIGLIGPLRMDYARVVAIL